MTTLVLKRERFLLATYLVVLSYVAFTPVNPESEGGFPWIFSVSSTMERFLNFFLLMPLPILVYLVYRKIKIIYLYLMGPMLSLSIETIQLWIPGRVSDWRDFLLNSAGSSVVALVIAFATISALRPTRGNPPPG
jgi:glycopeptide antibiotics resistance protein